MDDLLGEDWQHSSKPISISPAIPTSVTVNYSGFRASPQPQTSRTASPLNLSRPSSTVNASGGNAAAKAPTPSSDAFSSLAAFKSQKSASNVSIQERQRQLIEEKRRQQDQHAQLWDSLGSGRGTPEFRSQSPLVQQNQRADDDDDILAAFNKAAPVDRASHYPPPPSGAPSGASTPAVFQQPTIATNTSVGGGFDDDDPFGLGSMPKRRNDHTKAAVAITGDEDDILGDLAKPATQRPARRASPATTSPEWDENLAQSHAGAKTETGDRVLAELMDMGFPADKASAALAQVGQDVQAAISWLLQQAHEESKQQTRSEAPSRRRSPLGDGRSPMRQPQQSNDASPAWMRQERPSSAASRQDSRSPANGDKDAAQVAQELGNKLFKGANSLWKASQKQMAKTMAEFQQQERDPSQPKWMQDASRSDTPRSSSQPRPRQQAKQAPLVTDEAVLLDMPREAIPARPAKSNFTGSSGDIAARGRSPMESLPPRESSQPRLTAQYTSQQDKRPSSKLTRQEIEEQTAQAYVSPARRKRPTPKPETKPEPEVDLFSSAPAKQASSPAPVNFPPTSAQRPPAARPHPVPSHRPQAPPRNIPSVSPTALSTSAAHRKKGGEAFKRGDYAAAHEAYAAALSPLPPTHPIAIIVLTNRSLTALKTGDAKGAVTDADRALEVIGPSLGVGETIEVGGGESAKDMRDFYGKALMRKAEALEHMERWSDAAAVWRLAVEAGIGGSVSLRGKQRCEKAASPAPAVAKPKAAPARSATQSAAKLPTTKSLGNGLQRPVPTVVASGDAVKKLREANAAADKADDEKFALTDQVDARLAAWKGGKADNLRALLQSLDTVLWSEAGWKKVGMSDLVLPNKVKIIYMKAIAKVHPDKIPQTATTEQRMISASVFATLNEAWDKFKTDNGM